jgi:hypothetical protein
MPAQCATIYTHNGYNRANLPKPSFGMCLVAAGIAGAKHGEQEQGHRKTYGHW